MPQLLADSEESSRCSLHSSEGYSAEPPHVSGERRGPSQEQRQSNRWKAARSSPITLLSVGLALLAVGAALVATPLTLRHTLRRGSPPPPPAPATPSGGAVNEEGVPLDSIPSTAQQDGGLLDCRVELADRDGYVAAAEAAEHQLLGALAAQLPPGQLAQAVGQLQQPLLFGTVFWVLVSSGHPWSPGFSAAAAAQVDVLNAAFAGLGMRFRLDAVISTPVADDDAVQQCSARWAELEQQLLPAQQPPASSAPQLGSPSPNNNSGGGSSGGSGSGGGVRDPSAIHVIVCDPKGVAGAAVVPGGGMPQGSGSGGSILLQRSALWLSHTSLVHQLGHHLGLPHPFPDERQTCKLDGDSIADTPAQYAPHHACDPEGEMNVCLSALPDEPSADGSAGSGSGGSTMPFRIPILNFMDLTNDTCRRHFTPGQAVRMQAMLRSHRPRLFEAAAATPQPQQALALQDAWQSGLPPAAVLQQQAALAAAAEAQAVASDGDGGSTGPETAAMSASGQFAPAAAVSAAMATYRVPWRQAALAVDGQLSTSLNHCACIGPDSAGRVSWTGQLNASYAIDAVRLLLPTQLSLGGSISGGDGGSGSDEGTVPTELPTAEVAAAQASAAAEPMPEASAAGGVGGGEQQGLELEIRVGDSLDPAQNQLCKADAGSIGGGGSSGSIGSGSSLLLLHQQQESPLVEVRCQPPLAGRYISVLLSAGASLPGASTAAPVAAIQQQLARQTLCLCEVQPLTAVVPAVPAAAPAGLPGTVPMQVRPQPGPAQTQNASSAAGADSWQLLPAVPLQLSPAEAVAMQSSSGSGASGSGSASPDGAGLGAAGAAIAGWQVQPAPTKAGAAGRPGSPQQQCSSTRSERRPWWALDTGLDGAWVRGLRLTVPFSCASSTRNGSGGNSGADGSGSGTDAAGSCQPAPPANLTVYVGDELPASMVQGAGSGDSLCAAGIVVWSGQPVEIDCGSFMQGRHIVITVASPQAQPAPLLLCGVQLLGATELMPAQHMQTPSAAGTGGASSGKAQSALVVEPASLRPQFTLAIDGDSDTCLQLPGIAGSSGNSSSTGSTSTITWQLQLDRSYPLLGLQLVAAEAAPNGSLAVSLLDAGGGLVASWVGLPPTAAAAAAAAAAAGGGSNSGSSSFLLELPAARYAAAVRVEGFTSLCDLLLLTASQQPDSSYLLRPLPPAPSGSSSSSGGGGVAADQPQWRVLDASSISSSSGSSSSGSVGSDLGNARSRAVSAAALFDGDQRTCITLPALSAGTAAIPGTAAAGPDTASAASAHVAVLEVLLDRPYRLTSVQLVLGGAHAANVSIAAARPGAVLADVAAAWATADTCHPMLPLRPWQPTRATCSLGPLLTDRLLLQLSRSSTAAGSGGASVSASARAAGLGFSLCDLSLFGVPAFLAA